MKTIIIIIIIIIINGIEGCKHVLANRPHIIKNKTICLPIHIEIPSNRNVTRKKN